MNVNINCYSPNISTNQSFKHNNPWADSPYNKKERVIVAATTALGVATSMAIMAKRQGYSLKPSRMFKNIKNSYFFKVKYDNEVPVLAIGAGSCLGGLAGGLIIDKNKENRKAKLRETLLQAANISVPIIFVGRLASAGKYIGQKFLEKNPAKETLRTNIPKAIGGITGLIAGVYTANILANKINEKIFNRGKGRPVQVSDFSAHLDDVCMTAQQISSKSDIIHAIARVVPIALMIAGNEIGNTSTANVDS